MISTLLLVSLLASVSPVSPRVDVSAPGDQATLTITGTVYAIGAELIGSGEPERHVFVHVTRAIFRLRCECPDVRVGDRVRVVATWDTSQEGILVLAPLPTVARLTLMVAP